MQLTQHSEKRIRERVGVNKSSADRQLQLAMERGVHHADMKGNLRKWVDSKVFSRKEFRPYPIVYNNHLYLTNKTKQQVVTVLPVPQNIQKNIKKYIKSS
jgi:hypothetical protein